MSGQITFQFGDNWASYSQKIDQAKLQAAQDSLETLLGKGWLSGRSMLDVGCGSGLFSIAAARLGAQPVVGIDADPVAVHVSKENAASLLDEGASIAFQQLSILDQAGCNRLGEFDLVYAWGSLHHTGDMDKALEIASQRVRRGGHFALAIYNRHPTSPLWTAVKWFYNVSGKLGQRALVWGFTPLILIAKMVATRSNPLRMRRGMDFKHNVEDWLGGYPYEYASKKEMLEILFSLGFAVESISPAAVPTGCNEYLCRLTQ